MRKAVTGGMLWTIIMIIIGIAAIALLWLFISGAGGALEEQFDNLIDSFKNAICDLIPGSLGWVVGC